MIDDEIRAEIRRLIQQAREDPAREIEVVDYLADWCFCAAIVVQLAECGVVLPVELRPIVRDVAARIVRA
jgi:hypothetical protein